MLETVVKNGILFYAMGVVTLIGVVAKCISFVAVRKLAKAASEIQKSNHKLMRLVKAKFEHASMVSDKVKNVEAFVQKYMYEHRVLGSSVNTWRLLPLKMAWLNMVLGILGMAGTYSLENAKELFFQCGSVTAVSVIILFGLYMLGDEKRKLNAVQNYMVEYLENVCIHRYEKANQMAQREEQEVVLEEVKTTEEVKIVEEIDATKQREDQEMRIRAILEEFLA